MCGAQILLSNEALQKIDKESELLKEKQKFICLGKFELPDSPDGTCA